MQIIWFVIMNIYKWRKSFSATVADNVMRAEIAFKTRESYWINTPEPVVILMSIYSRFHEGLEEELKMQALYKIIKENVTGRVTLLLAEKAHINVMGLKYSNERAVFNHCLEDTEKVLDRFKKKFTDCKIAFWHSYIEKAVDYTFFHNQIRKLYKIDPIFKEYLKEDAEEVYTKERVLESSNQDLFMEKTIEDILEQCVSVLVLVYKGYRFQFYPGTCYKSLEYVSSALLSKEARLSLIPVFLTIEQKNREPIRLA